MTSGSDYIINMTKFEIKWIELNFIPEGLGINLMVQQRNNQFGCNVNTSFNLKGCYQDTGNPNILSTLTPINNIFYVNDCYNNCLNSNFLLMYNNSLTANSNSCLCTNTLSASLVSVGLN